MSPTPDDHGGDRRGELPPASRAGLCATCRHVQRIESAKGSVFLLCTRSKTDPRFPKYPPQPVRACSGFSAGS